MISFLDFSVATKKIIQLKAFGLNIEGGNFQEELITNNSFKTNTILINFLKLPFYLESSTNQFFPISMEMLEEENSKHEVVNEDIDDRDIREAMRNKK